MFCNRHGTYVTRLMCCTLQQPSWVLRPTTCGFTLKTLKTHMCRERPASLMIYEWPEESYRLVCTAILRNSSMKEPTEDLTWTLKTIPLVWSKNLSRGYNSSTNWNMWKYSLPFSHPFNRQKIDHFNKVHHFLVEVVIVMCSGNSRKT